MRHSRFTFKKPVYGLLENGVGFCNAFVLAQMLEPADSTKKVSKNVPGGRCILEDIPTKCAVAQPFVPQAIRVLSETARALWHPRCDTRSSREPVRHARRRPRFTTGTGHDIDGVRSTLPVLRSFQRQVSGIASSIPAAAAKCALGKPVRVATCPQIALPTVRAPNITVM